MSSYWKIVFGIKQKYHIRHVLEIFKQQRFSILITQHNALDEDDCCDRPDVHYHGMVEFISGDGKIENLLSQLSPYCIYINGSHCNNPVDYLAYITLPPKRTVVQEILDSSKMLEYVQTACSMQLEVLRRKKEKKLALIERNNDIINLVDFILKSGSNSNNILSQLKKNEPLWESLKKNYNSIKEKALSISKKIILNNSILSLSDRLEMSDDYLSPEESAQFVKDWCSFQNLDPKAFTKNIVRCLDRKSGNRNSIYLQGSRNSGKTYIVQSIEEACTHVGHVTGESSAYAFAWEKCVDKRLIVISEPHFSLVNFDQLDKILSGSGTLIFKHNDIVDYLLPTPVIILANEHEWTDNPALDEKIKKRFFCCYTGLKTFPKILGKKLHPRWLNLLNKAFSGKNISTPEQKHSDTPPERPLHSNPVKNNGMELIRGELMNYPDKNVISHSSEINGNGDLFTNEVSNTYQDSENRKASNHKNGKRPMRDNGNNGVWNKMRAWM